METGELLFPVRQECRDAEQSFKISKWQKWGSSGSSTTLVVHEGSEVSLYFKYETNSAMTIGTASWVPFFDDGEHVSVLCRPRSLIASSQ